MAKGKWKISMTVAGGAVVYQIYRLHDVNKVDHSGNREIKATFEDRKEAEEYLKYMEAMEEKQ